jgi:glycosyltransferase involved in cell wall biosynthesis
MKIWHVGPFISPNSVCGINTAAWAIAKEQALLGHQIALIITSPPDQPALALAKETGLELLHIPEIVWRYDDQTLKLLLDSQRPDVVHMHSVFQPKHATLAIELVKRHIPYIITPNGGLMPQVLQRGRIKKSIYSWLIEQPLFRAAAAIVLVLPKEERDVRTFVPNYKGITRWISNPINSRDSEGKTWNNTGAKQLIYLGRFDVLHKGIDILVEIAQYLPDVEFHLYGSNDAKTKDWLEKIKLTLTPNVHFHAPIFGAEKFSVLSHADFYIQTSRWEGFGISIAEAMYIGTPCAITNTLNFADLFHQHDLGLVLSANPQEAATSLSEALNSPTQLQQWSEHAKQFAQTHFDCRSIALNHLQLYEEVALREPTHAKVA